MVRSNIPLTPQGTAELFVVFPPPTEHPGLKLANYAMAEVKEPKSDPDKEPAYIDIDLEVGGQTVRAGVTIFAALKQGVEISAFAPLDELDVKVRFPDPDGPKAERVD